MAHENTPTFSRSQQIRLVPPRSPLYSKRGLESFNQDYADNGGEVGYMSSRSPLESGRMFSSLSKSSSVRQPKILEDTSRLLSEKPKEVPRSVVQRAFNVWDSDRDEYVDFEDLQRQVTASSLRISTEELQEMFQLALQGFDSGHAPPPSPHILKYSSSRPSSPPSSSSAFFDPQQNIVKPSSPSSPKSSSKQTVGRHVRLKVDHVVYTISPKRIQVKPPKDGRISPTTTTTSVGSPKLKLKSEDVIRKKEWQVRPYLDEWLSLIEATLGGHEPILSPPSTAPIKGDKFIMSYRERTGFTAEGGLQSPAKLQVGYHGSQSIVSPNTGRLSAITPNSPNSATSGEGRGGGWKVKPKNNLKAKSSPTYQPTDEEKLTSAILKRRPRSRAHGAIMDPKPEDFNGTRGLAFASMELSAGKSVSNDKGNDVVINYLKSTETNKSFPPITDGQRNDNNNNGYGDNDNNNGYNNTDDNSNDNSNKSDGIKKYLENRNVTHLIQNKTKKAQSNLFNRLKEGEYGFKVVSSDNNLYQSRQHSILSNNDEINSNISGQNSHNELVNNNNNSMSNMKNMNKGLNTIQTGEGNMSIAGYMEQQHKLMKAKNSQNLTTQPGPNGGIRLVEEASRNLQNLSQNNQNNQNQNNNQNNDKEEEDSVPITMNFEVKNEMDKVEKALIANSQFASRSATLKHVRASPPMNATARYLLLKQQQGSSVFKAHGSPAAIDLAVRTSFNHHIPVVDGMWRGDGGGGETLSGDDDACLLTSKGIIKGLSDKPGDDVSWQRTFFPRRTNAEWRNSIAHVVKEKQQDIGNGYANNKVDEYERQLMIQDRRSLKNCDKPPIVFTNKLEDMLHMKTRVAAEQFGLFGLSTQGVFEKNVEKPYKHVFRDEPTRVNKHSTLQLAPARLHGAAYLKSLKLYELEQKELSCLENQNGNNQNNIKNYLTNNNNNNTKKGMIDSDNVSVNSSVSGVYGDMENIEFKPMELEGPGSKLKRERMEALLNSRNSSGGSNNNANASSRSNSLKPKKRFSSLLNGEE